MQQSVYYRIIIKSLFRTLRPRTYLEVGCKSGETLRFIIDDAREIGTKVYAIDTSDVKSKLPKGVSFMQGDSAVIGKEWDTPLDMVFIDADHNSVSVLNDFANFSKHVKPNGIILLHDTYPSDVKKTSSNECGDCWKAAWKIRNEFHKEFEIVTIPLVNGLSIIRKSEVQVDWQKTGNIL